MRCVMAAAPTPTITPARAPIDHVTASAARRDGTQQDEQPPPVAQGPAQVGRGGDDDRRSRRPRARPGTPGSKGIPPRRPGWWRHRACRHPRRHGTAQRDRGRQAEDQGQAATSVEGQRQYEQDEGPQGERGVGQAPQQVDDARQGLEQRRRCRVEPRSGRVPRALVPRAGRRSRARAGRRWDGACGRHRRRRPHPHEVAPPEARRRPPVIPSASRALDRPGVRRSGVRRSVTALQCKGSRKGGTRMKKWWPLVALAMAQFVMVLDQSVMNVSISTLVDDFDTTVTTIQTVITLYCLTMAMFMLTGGKIGDIIGRRQGVRHRPGHLRLRLGASRPSPRPSPSSRWAGRSSRASARPS